VLALLLSCCGLVAWADHHTMLIHAGTLVDGFGGEPVTERTIVVEGNAIVGIERGFRAAADGETVIDLSDHTVMPGFIDMHVHLTGETSPTEYTESFRMNPEDTAFRSAVWAERTLAAGFTTVRDVGGPVAIALRDAVNTGWAEGPRIFAAGISIASTGGHGDSTNNLRRDLFHPPGPVEGVANGRDEVRAAVRQRYKDGADLIKITATGGVLSQASSGQNAQFTIEEIREIVATAEDYGFHVAAHAHGTEGMRRAVLGGVRTIEHGTYMSDEVMDLMIEHGTYYVPTIIAGKFVAEKAEIDGYFTPIVRPKARAIGPLIQETFARAYARGVPILFGTDTGVSAHGDNWKEFVYMAEAGMPMLEAITVATSVPAAVLGREDIGAIEVGRLADIVAVRGDPLAEPALMGAVSFVMKDGEVYRDGD
jgi:imidazolonepropionase-like amidohydrolase